MWDSNRSSVQRYRRTESGAFFIFRFSPPQIWSWSGRCKDHTKRFGRIAAAARRHGHQVAIVLFHKMDLELLFFGNTYSGCCKLAQLPYLRCNRPRRRDSVCKVPVVGRSLGCSEKSRRAVSPAHSKRSGVFVGNRGGQQWSVTKRTGPQSRGDCDIKQGCREGPRINPLMSHPMDGGGSENL